MLTRPPAGKKCSVCETYKFLDKFPKNRRKKDGRDPACKDCTNARMREKYHTDEEWRDQKIVATRQYHLDHPEWSKERLRAHHVNHREERYERHMERGKDPEVRAKRRSASQRSEARRRAIKAQSSEIDVITDEDLAALLDSYDGLCAICDRELCDDLPLRWDHIRPLARDGVHTLANHQPLCDPCNVRKNAVWPLTEARKAEIRRDVLALVGIVETLGEEVIAR